jgi:hypothetical protein
LPQSYRNDRADRDAYVQGIGVTCPTRLGGCRLYAGRGGERKPGHVRPDQESSSITKHLINWYPGHIAKAEKELQDFLKAVDVVIEARDARIPISTTHPSVRQCTRHADHSTSCPEPHTPSPPCHCLLSIRKEDPTTAHAGHGLVVTAQGWAGGR